MFKHPEIGEELTLRILGFSNHKPPRIICEKDVTRDYLQITKTIAQGIFAECKKKNIKMDPDLENLTNKIITIQGIETKEKYLTKSGEMKGAKIFKVTIRDDI